MKIHRKIIGVFLSLAIILTIIASSPLLESVELRALNLLYKIRGKERISKDIVLITQEGCSKRKIALLLDKLKDARLVAILPIPSHPGTLEDDLILASSFSRNGVFLASHFFIPYSVYSAKVPIFLPKKNLEQFSLDKIGALTPYQAIDVAAPLSLFLQTARGLGHTNLLPDNMGVIRKVPLVIEYDGNLYPSLSLILASSYRRKPPESFLKARDEKCRMLINFGGEALSYKMADVLRNKIDPKVFSQKIVLVGSEDKKVLTPYGVSSSLILQAEALGNLIKGNFLVPVSFKLMAILLLILGIIVSLLGLAYPIRIGGGMAFLLLFAYLFFSFSLFCFGVVMNIVTPVLAIGAGFITSFGYKQFLEEREKKYVRSLFGKVVLPHVIDGILNERESFLQVRRKELTILFCDIADSSRMIEKLAPEKVLSILNYFFDEMTGVIVGCQGTVDKFIGDCVLSFFGDPIDIENHALSAVEAAILMQKRIERLNNKFGLEEPIKLRIGINTGEVMVGNIGSKERTEYTVLGENVNLAERLQQLAEPGSIFISEKTHLLCPQIETEFLGGYEIKGFALPTKVYKVLWR